MGINISNSSVGMIEENIIFGKLNIDKNSKVKTKNNIIIDKDIITDKEKSKDGRVFSL